MRIRQLSFDFGGPAEVELAIPVEILIGDTAEQQVPSLSSLDYVPNDASPQPDLIGG